MFVQTVNQMDVRLGECFEARLILGMDQVLRNVVQQESEIRNPQLSNTFQLVGESLEIRLAGIDHGKAGADGETEVNEVLSRGVRQFAHVLQLLRRITLAPKLAVIRIILRTVNVDVHPVLPLEAQHVKAVSVAPGRSVEAFDNASDGE